MPEITVKIPDGNYCGDCKFMEHYDYPLVDMFGNETGNRRAGYKCRYYNSDLEVEDFGCYQKIKKCFWCNSTEEERNAFWIYSMLLFASFDKKPDTKENTDNDYHKETKP